jgi:hypothetical protein
VIVMTFLSRWVLPNGGPTGLRGDFGAGRVRRRCRRLLVEALEPRQLLSGLTLTAAAQAAGFSLSTFATGFPQRSDGLGPTAVAFPASGGVLVDDGPGNVRLFPNDTDGQNATMVPPVSGASYGQSHASGIARVGNSLYLMMGELNQIAQINDDGTLKKVIVNLTNPDGVAVNPLNGHLFVSGYNNAIYDVDPVAGKASVFLNVTADGLAFDPNAGILYAAVYPGASRVEGFDIGTKAMVFDSGTIAGAPDGIALGTGSLAGTLFVNTNGGTLVEVNLATTTQTVMASGGSRGDFVTVDPSNDTLLVTQSDRILRLTPPSGAGFAIPLHLVSTTTTLDATPKTSSFGQTVTLTAVVTTAGTGTPTGTVSFTIDGQTQAPVGLIIAGGQDEATFSTKALEPGAHTITAVYNGDTYFASSVSNSVSPAVVSVDGPRVVSVRVQVKRHGAHAKPPTLVLTFDEALNPGLADDVADYQLVVARRKHRTTLAIRSVAYDSAMQTVTLTPARRLNRNQHYQLTIKGTGPTGVADTRGNLLDGQGNGQPGSDFVTTVTASNFVTS